MIVKHVHLHILPTMNPDGFALRRRGNANNVDLNRDFPDQVSFHVHIFIMHWYSFHFLQGIYLSMLH